MRHHEVMLLGSERADMTGDLSFLYRGQVIIYCADEKAYYLESAAQEWPASVETFSTLAAVQALVDSQVNLTTVWAVVKAIGAQTK